MSGDVERLRAVAEAATPGPWHSDRLFIAHGHESEDATHIAAFDPPTVLTLLDRLAAAEAAVARVAALPRHRMKVGWANFTVEMVTVSDLTVALAGPQDAPGDAGDGS